MAHDVVRPIRIDVWRNHHQHKLSTVNVVEIHQIYGLTWIRTSNFEAVDLVDTTLRSAHRVPVERNPGNRPQTQREC